MKISWPEVALGAIVCATLIILMMIDKGVIA